MKEKLVISTIFLGMMVALTGTAAAFNLGIDGGGLVSIGKGQSQILDLTASGFNPATLNTQHTLSSMSVECSATNPAPYDSSCSNDLITVTVNTNTFTPTSDPFLLPGAVTIANDPGNPDPAGTEYIIYLQINSETTGGFAVASAFNIAISGPGLIKLKAGDSKMLDMTASGISQSDFGSTFILGPFTVECSKLNPAPLDVSCNTQGVLNGLAINNGLDMVGFTPTSSTYQLPGAITITMPTGPNTDPVGTEYIISIVGGSGASLAFSIASIDASSIPEFPTVAMPIVAIIGMLFYFQHRKKN